MTIAVDLGRKATKTKTNLLLSGLLRQVLLYTIKFNVYPI